MNCFPLSFVNVQYSMPFQWNCWIKYCVDDATPYHICFWNYICVSFLCFFYESDRATIYWELDKRLYLLLSDLKYCAHVSIFWKRVACFVLPSITYVYYTIGRLPIVQFRLVRFGHRFNHKWSLDDRRSEWTNYTYVCLNVLNLLLVFYISVRTTLYYPNCFKKFKFKI